MHTPGAVTLHTTFGGKAVMTSTISGHLEGTWCNKDPDIPTCLVTSKQPLHCEAVQLTKRVEVGGH